MRNFLGTECRGSLAVVVAMSLFGCGSGSGTRGTSNSGSGGATAGSENTGGAGPSSVTSGQGGTGGVLAGAIAWRADTSTPADALGLEVASAKSALRMGRK